MLSALRVLHAAVVYSALAMEGYGGLGGVAVEKAENGKGWDGGDGDGEGELVG